MKRLILICAGGLLLIAGVWAFWWWQSPAETRDFTSDEQTSQAVLGSEVNLVSWQTKHFTTRYPDNLRVITSNELAHGNTSGQYLLGAVSLKQTDQLAITVGTLEGSTLRELPAVRLRQQHTETYQPADRSFLPDGGLVFSSTKEYETAMFWRHGSSYAAVVVSGSAVRQAELEEALQAVVTNWQWRD